MYSLKINEKIKSEINKYEAGEETSEMIFIDVRDDNNFPLKTVLDVEAMSPIMKSEFGQSVLCKFLNNDQYARIAEIEDLIEVNNPKEMEVKEFTNGTQFYVKLPVKEGKYTFSSEDVTDPDFEISPIKEGTVMSIYCRPGVWMNFKSKRSGMFLRVEKITFETPNKPQKKVRVTKK